MVVISLTLQLCTVEAVGTRGVQQEEHDDLACYEHHVDQQNCASDTA